MSGNDTAVMGIRFAAVYAWLRALDYLATGFITFFWTQAKFFGGPVPFGMLLALLPCAILTAAGVFLWLRAATLARYFLATPSDAAAAPRSAVSLAFGIAGVAVFLYALPRFVEHCGTLLLNKHFAGRYAEPAFLQYLPVLAGSFLQLLGGFLLFVRSDALARAWERKRGGNPSV